MYYTYFYSELGLWYNSKDGKLKPSKQCFTKFMKRFKFSNKTRTNKNLKNLEKVESRCQHFHSSSCHFLRTHHNFYFVGVDKLLISSTFNPEQQCAVDKGQLPLY